MYDKRASISFFCFKKISARFGTVNRWVITNGANQRVGENPIITFNYLVVSVSIIIK